MSQHGIENSPNSSADNNQPEAYQLPALHNEGVSNPQSEPLTDEEVAQHANTLGNAPTGIPPQGERHEDYFNTSGSQETKGKFWTRGKKIGAAATAAIALVGGGLGIGKSLGGNEANQPQPHASAPLVPGQTGETTPSQNTTTTPESGVSIDPEAALENTTYHAYLKDHPDKANEVGVAAIAEVDIPTAEWDALSKTERATRTANYIEVGVESCFSTGVNLISDTSEETQRRLDSVNWSPYITKDMVDSAVNGDLKALDKIETIRRMYECSIGSAYGNGYAYSSQVKTNLMKDFYLRPPQDTVNRDDYINAGGHSMLNTNEIKRYGGTINLNPAYEKDMPFDGLSIYAPTPAWTRGGEVDPGQYATVLFPTSTANGKAIPMFTYSSDR